MDGDPDAIAVAERMSLVCAVMQRRIRQACRLRGCGHAAAFCAEALPTLATPRGYRCPYCGNEATESEVDAPLTLLLSAHPSAESVGVRRGGGD